MNYYEQVAKMLGLELDEKFKLRNDEANYCDDTFYFSKYGLKELDAIYNCNGILDEILSGKAEIVKLPWKPKQGEKYWWYSLAWKQAIETKWVSSYSDLLEWKIGNYFRTEEEANAKGKALVEQIKNEYEEA